jgi:[ribosomal protein S5]-alanine N-acetyltransferase
LALAFGFGELKLYRIYASAFEDNAGSCRVLKKCGFTREGVLREVMVVRGKRRNFVNYGILRPEWNGS